ncbi:MAG: 3-deoxy-D-manno-octulosonic acid transferase [Rickettsiales bacterium]|nr:3-deoxy-D-manno-octulosonic acid transferase [Pseudomonadota bacterium]MDA0967017.1 3-deoxy-D-manno-octulosonic acid transferase [Pseudomonadota bacterium]MDG4543937.1 3-deoxy-D-manno-octulosonic acid transferase [Rickettsiales bacterium]MDG4546083.1 3-deoxy-D-manno-octulosonic acid transferase [Rickettsiales bacterium]MDG4548329.1 3-deoxy-D-manno-octulosonic acid transferase [Rickettsiales bacterium]
MEKFPNPSNDNTFNEAKNNYMLLKLYKFLTFIGSPLIDLYLFKRKKTGKEDSKRFPERLGYPAFPRPEGTLVWVHAASVGEALSVLPIIKKLSDSNEDTNFLLTTGTTTSAKLIESRLPDKAFHQFVPVDMPLAVRRFLKHWKPDLALWVESELWPNLVTQTGKKCKMILVNGRISDNSYRKWLRYKSLGQQILRCFTLTLPQSKLDAERFEALGAGNVKYFGNIKFDAPALPSDSQKMGELVSQVGERPVWLASSTHENEEVIIANIHKELKEENPNLLTIIAPRHPKRMAEIVKDIKETGLNIAVRSKEEPIEEETDIYIADTLGELGIFYRLVSIVFIGGSLVDKGGQNPLEAARLDCTIIYGPYMDNFKEIKHELEEAEAVICVNNKSDLKNTIEELIKDHERQDELAKSARKLVDEKAGVLDSYVKEINTYLEQITGKKDKAA